MPSIELSHLPGNVVLNTNVCLFYGLTSRRMPLFSCGTVFVAITLCAWPFILPEVPVEERPITDMGMYENWRLFVKSSKSKAEGHLKVAKRWDSVHTFLNFLMIFLSSATTMLALLASYVPFLATAGVSGSMTLVSAIAGFLGAAERKEIQLESSRQFRSLMMRMVRCEKGSEYEQLWKDYNKALTVEPLLPKQCLASTSVDYTMTPELWELICEKEKGEKFGTYGTFNNPERKGISNEQNKDIDANEERDSGYITFGTFKVLQDGNVEFGRFKDTDVTNITYGTFKVGENGDISGDDVGAFTKDEGTESSAFFYSHPTRDQEKKMIEDMSLINVEEEESYKEELWKNVSFQVVKNETTDNNDEAIKISIIGDDEKDKNILDSYSSNTSLLAVENEGGSTSCFVRTPFSRLLRMSTMKESLMSSDSFH